MNWTAGTSHRQQHYNAAAAAGWGLTFVSVLRWSIPLGAQRVMDAVKESHKSSLSSGRMVALAAGLSVGATVGYMVYRHISSTNNSEYTRQVCVCVC